MALFYIKLKIYISNIMYCMLFMNHIKKYFLPLLYFEFNTNIEY